MTAYKIDHDYHIHTSLSTCSGDSEQNVQNILGYAKRNGLKKLCITDHFWDSKVPGASPWYAKQNYGHISAVKPLPTSRDTELLFGCESEMRRDFILGIARESFDDFDFVIIPTTHLHMDGFTINAEDVHSNERRAELWYSRLNALFDMDLPFRKIGIAHPICPLVCKYSREDYLDVISRIPTERIYDVMSRAAKLGVGIEINGGDKIAPGEEDVLLRIHRVARSCGCKFYLGSDAHHPKDFDSAMETFEKYIRLLDLREIDKFHIGT